MILRVVVLTGHGHAQADPGHGGVDTDHLGFGVGQRAAGVAWVKGGVGLDDVLDEPTAAAAGRHRPAECADHARGHRASQAERVADRYDQLADDEIVGFAELSGRRGRAGGAEHGQVGQGVGADHAEGGRRTVRKRRRATIRLPDDVCVGEYESVAGEDDTRAEALAAPAAAAARDAQASHLGRQLLGHAGNDLRVHVQWTVCGHGPPPVAVITVLQANRLNSG